MDTVQFDANCYYVNGQPVWLASGEIHYFKLTRGDWKRRLLQMKLAGFNTVSVYMPWNYHEAEEGQWDFDGDKDVSYFLQLACEMGLFVIARPGPFICNEWQSGGIPPWLSGKTGVRLRTADPLYLAYCDKWWDRIAPIIEKYQLGNDGTVILVQVENEYGHMGENQEGDYIYHLRDGLRQRGIQVPVINCDSFIRFARLKPKKWDGINLCCNFGGDAWHNFERARLLQPDAPLFVTEYWIAAFDYWGLQSSAVYDDSMAVYGALEIVAAGAAGLNAFVFSGGAHFGYWHGCSICSDNNFMTTLYGPGAPILDDGILNRKYYLLKRNFTGLMVSQGSLATSGAPQVSSQCSDVTRFVRMSEDTAYTFYVNHSPEQQLIAQKEKEQAAVDMSIPAGAVLWSVKNLPLAQGFRLKESNGQVFAGSPALVIYGDGGQLVHLELECDSPVVDVPGDSRFTAVAGEQSVRLIAKVPSGEGYCSCVVASNEQRLRVVLMNSNEIDRCWKADMPGLPRLILYGPDRIESIEPDNKSLRICFSAAMKRCCDCFTQSGIEKIDVSYQGDIQTSEIPLGVLRYSRTFEEAEPDYDDSDWLASPQPLCMAKFGHGQGRAWYRARLHVTAGGPQMIFLSGAADRALVFVDGKYLTVRGANSHFGWHFMACLTPGEHVLAILFENLGMMNTGAEMEIAMGEPKGLYGPVWMNGSEITGWTMRAGLRAQEQLDFWPEVQARADWTACAQEPGMAGPVWVTAAFEMPDGFDGAVRLMLGDAAGKGSVWLNGYNIGRYWNIGPQQSLWMPLSRLKKHNELVFFEELSIDPGRITVKLQPFGYQGEALLSL